MNRRSMLHKAAICAIAAAMLVGPVSSASAKVVVKYWAKWGGMEGEFIKDVVDRYNKSQNQVEVKYSIIDAEQIHEKFLTTTVAGAGPDLITLWNHRLDFFVKADLIRPLDPYLKDMGLDKKALLPRYWDMSTIDGRIYGLPITNSCFGLYTNKTVFSESGLDPDTAPKTFDDMVTLGEKVARKDSSGKYSRVGFALNDPGWWPYIWPVAFGADLYDEKKNIVDFKQPGMVKSYDFISNMSKKWGANILSILKAGGNSTKSSALFSGKTAMEINGSWVPSNVAKVMPNLKYGIYPLPYGGTRTQTWSWLESDMIFLAKTKRTKEALDFIRYLMSPEVQRLFNLKRETFSAVKEANNADFMKENGNPAIDSLVKLAGSDQATYAPKTIIWTDLANAFSTVFNDTWNQKKSATQALAEASKVIDVSLKKVQRRNKK